MPSYRWLYTCSVCERSLDTNTSNLKRAAEIALQRGWTFAIQEDLIINTACEGCDNDGTNISPSP